MGLQEAQLSQAICSMPHPSTHPPTGFPLGPLRSLLPAPACRHSPLLAHPFFIRSLPLHSLICSLILSNDPSPQLGHLRPESGLQLQEARVKDGSAHSAVPVLGGSKTSLAMQESRSLPGWPRGAGPFRGMCGSGALTQSPARGLQRPEGQGSAGTGQERGDHRGPVVLSQGS